MLRTIGHTRRPLTERGSQREFKLSSCFIRSSTAAICGGVGTLSQPASALHRFEIVLCHHKFTGRTLIDGARNHISSRSRRAVP